MSKFIAFCVIYLTIHPQAFTQTAPPASSIPSQPPVPFVTQIKKTVVFVQTECRHIKPPEEVADANSPEKQSDFTVGTGFIVGFLDSRLPAGQTFGYLVTNHHVAQPGIEKNNPCEVINQSVRLNLKGANQVGSSGLVSIGAKPGWVFPDDQSVDLAAIGMNPQSDVFDFMQIPMTMAATKDVMTARHVVEGDSVIFSGLFIQWMGQIKMQPIVRTGTLAMLPDEPIMTTLNKPGKVYLAEAHAFGGNSGSPMFINLGGLREGAFSGRDYKFLGVVSGEYNETQSLELKVTTLIKGNIAQNSGISTVVPADEVIALLNSPALKVKRDEYIASLPKP